MIIIPLRGGRQNAHQRLSVQLGENLVDLNLNWSHLTGLWAIDISIDGVKKLSGGVLAAGATVSRHVNDIGGTLYFIGDDATIDNLGESNKLVWEDDAVEILSIATPSIELSSATYSVLEANSFNIVINRIGDTTGQSGCFLTMSDGTGIAGQNYVDNSQVVSFAAGETTKNVVFDTVVWGIWQPKTVNIDLGSFSASVAGDIVSAVVTIQVNS